MPSPEDSSASKISEIDRELLRLIQERDALVQDLAGSAASTPLRAEHANLEALVAASKTPEANRTSLTQVLKHVASHSRQVVDPQQVSFLGPKYSYSHLAAIKYFGDAAQFAPVANIPAVFDSVHRGDAKHGLVPIENSTDGRVVDTLGMFVRRHMQICGEVLLPIHHNLLAVGQRDAIAEIHSKPQALSQCRGWLAVNFPGAKLVEVSSTTAAAKAASGDPRIAAVASLPAGRAYGLDVINANIEDNPDNVTRFAVLGTDEPDPTDNDKTSLLFQVAHQPGALAEAMMVFREAKLNLTWIESFPSPESRSEYLFFTEFTGHRSEKRVAGAIDALGKLTHRLEILGSYPAATLDA